MKSSGLKFTVGSDTHNVGTVEAGILCGLIFDHRLRTTEELIAALRSGEGKVYKKQK